MKRLFGTALILSLSLLLWRCATQTTPTGGPKDEKPPQLKKSIPANNQTNFKGKTIELTFDELIKVDNAKEEIIITPNPGKDVQFLAKQNRVIIEPKNGWKDSTTYSISFREGIKDLNEGNPAVDLHLAFSTGATIDSLQISGKITESLTEKIPEKITVGLYQSDTFDIFKHTPEFFARTNKSGSYKIENLKEGEYKLYAFDDKNKNLKVESTSEKFGFIPSTIKISRNIDTLNLALYKVDSRLPKINSIRNTGAITLVTLNKNLIDYRIKSSEKKPFFHSFGETQSEITIFNQLELNDSVKVNLHGVDSLFNSIDSTFFIKRVESKQPKDKFSTKLTSAKINPDTYRVEITGHFSKPVQLINYDSIYLSPDDIPERTPKEKPSDKKKGKDERDISKPVETKKDTTAKKIVRKWKISPNEISIDTIRKNFQVSTSLDKKLIPEKTTKLNVAIEEEFLLSVEADSSKRIIQSMPIKNDQDAGILHIEVKTTYKNYEVHLLTASGTLVEKVRNLKKYSFK